MAARIAASCLTLLTWVRFLPQAGADPLGIATVPEQMPVVATPTTAIAVQPVTVVRPAPTIGLDESDRDQLVQAVAAEVVDRLEQPRSGGIHWRHPRTAAEVEDLLSQAKAQ